MNLKGIIFDLDGTLLDTLGDIADAENNALAELNLPPRKTEDYRWIVGGGAENLAQKLLPKDMQSEKHINHFVQRFRLYYHQNWHTKTKPYDGIPELLNHLITLNIPLAILSNKPEEFTLKIVNHYFSDYKDCNSAQLFTCVYGQSSRFPLKPDPTLALLIANTWGMQPSEIGFVGDSDIDIYTAINAGMIPIGATWGFRGKNELVASGAQILLTQPLDLINYITGN